MFDTRKLRSSFGYAMTFLCRMCAILPHELMRYESIGLPVPPIKIKLLDVVDAGYLASNTTPQGEICICGPSILSGYYKCPDLNADTIRARICIRRDVSFILF